MKINHLKQVLIASVILVGLAGCQPKMPTDLVEGEVVVDILFDSENDKLPSSVMVDDDYFQKTGHVFFINQDYSKTYSQLVEYDTELMETVQVLDEVEGDFGIITEYDINDGKVVWAKILREGLRAEIRSYDIETGGIVVVPSEIYYGKRRFTTSLSTDENAIAWVEHDIKKGQSKVILYDLETEKRQVIETADFDDDFFEVPIFFVSLRDGKLFYDLKEGDKASVYMKTIRGEEAPEKLETGLDLILHFAVDYDKKNEDLVLYGSTKREEVIHLYNLKNKTTVKLASLGNHTYLNQDKIWIRDKKLYFSVRMDVTGKIEDNYFSQTIDLREKNENTILKYFYSFLSNKHYATLKFEGGSNKIRFELIEAAS